MVSNASDDLPDPDTPVTTDIRLCGMSSEMFLRLWTRAPRIRMESCTEVYRNSSIACASVGSQQAQLQPVVPREVPVERDQRMPVGGSERCQIGVGPKVRARS